MGEVQHHRGADQVDRWRKRARRMPSRRLPRPVLGLIFRSIGTLAGTVTQFVIENAASLQNITTWAKTAVDPNCDIKGNISYNTGKKIYHVPGQEYYWETCQPAADASACEQNQRSPFNRLIRKARR